MGLGLVTALGFTRTLSNGRKQNEKRRWTYHSHLDIKYHLWWNLSPPPVQGSELSQGGDVNYVMPCLFVAGTCFTRTFLQQRSPPPSCQPRETDDVLYGNKEKLFSICHAPYSRKSVTGPLQTTPHPRTRRAVVAWGIVKRLIEPCITELHFSSIRSLFPLVSSSCVPSL